MVRDGYYYGLALIAAGILLGWLTRPAWAILPILLACFFLWFFRDPERAIPQEPDALVSPADQARLRAYHDRLVETVAKAPNKVSLAALMPPLFQTVLERGGGGGDMLAENRAAIVTLAFYVNGTGLAAIAPAVRSRMTPVEN